MGAPGTAGARDQDINLRNLCDYEITAPGVLGARVQECSWVKRNAATGLIESIQPDGEAASRFRSLASELALALAPRVSVPAETLGLAGFTVTGELGLTSVSQHADYWNGIDAVNPTNPTGARGASWLTTLGAFVRKGFFLPIPLEFGAGFMHLLESHLVSWQGYAKLALHEGFHDWPLPSFAVRASLAKVTGSDEMRLGVKGVDLILSKGFGVLKTSRVELFGGWSFLFIDARSGYFDLTPSCDARAAAVAAPGAALGDYCAAAQAGTTNDELANWRFPAQDGITRHRVFGGGKMKLGGFTMTAQYEFAPAGKSRDERIANGARDGSAAQHGVSLSAGFDY